VPVEGRRARPRCAPSPLLSRVAALRGWGASFCWKAQRAASWLMSLSGWTDKRAWLERKILTSDLGGHVSSLGRGTTSARIHSSGSEESCWRGRHPLRTWCGFPICCRTQFKCRCAASIHAFVSKRKALLFDNFQEGKLSFHILEHGAVDAAVVLLCLLSSSRPG
jgi:hypothetical protein